MGLFPRRRSRGRRRLLGWAVATVLVLGNAALLTALTEDAPTDHFVRIDATLRAAERAEAPRRAGDLFAIARGLRDAARREHARQSERFLWFRDYAGVRTCLAASRVVAQAAEGRAERGRGRDLESLGVRLDLLGARLASASSEMDGIPIRGTSQRALSRGELLYHRAVEAHRGGDPIRGAALVDEADRALGEARIGFQREVDASFADAPAWARWARAGIERSRAGGTTLVLVDKLRHRCHLYERGRLVKSYRAELGPYWLGHKERSGDRRTPEGVYRVVEKKSVPSTKYHKALLLNYPNDEDRRRFAASRKAGRIPRGARIGGLIEVHGDGGRGYDWTLGCVALANRDIDDLYARVDEGTPVIIVGRLPDDLVRGD